jgi:hypothetical protein
VYAAQILDACKNAHMHGNMIMENRIPVRCPGLEIVLQTFDEFRVLDE